MAGEEAKKQPGYHGTFPMGSGDEDQQSCEKERDFVHYCLQYNRNAIIALFFILLKKYKRHKIG